jgi:hypothetical protein
VCRTSTYACGSRFSLSGFPLTKHDQTLKMKWWKLKEVAKMFKERVLKEVPWHEGGDANSMWMNMSTCIRKVASEEFRVSKGGKRETKEI